jgi:photosystem II stability/assembly factor-like uncharacterized protein
MILKKLFLSAICLTIGLLACITASGQQGWSQAHKIKVSDKAATLSSIFFDGEVVWIVGADGLILRSEDYGGNFQKIDSRVTEGLNDVFALKDRVWIIGDGGTMFFSTDRGRSFVKNWYSGYRRRTNSTAGGPNGSERLDLYSVQFIDREKGFVVGDEGLILRSNDGGVTWAEQQSGTDAQLFHLSFRGKRGWAVGTGGVILHTDDGGGNWYPQRSGVDTDLNRVMMASEEIGFITGDNGLMLRTENGGATWSQISVGTDQPLFGMSFLDKKTGWVVGYQGTIVRTYDGGRNWVQQESGTETDLFSVSFNKHRGFAIGREGLVMKYFEKR